MLAVVLIAGSCLALGAAGSIVAVHTHSFCYQPTTIPNVTFGGAQAFLTPGSPSILLSYASSNVPSGQHVDLVQGLDIVPNGNNVSCKWVNTDAKISEARVSGCSTSFEDTIIFAGGHNNSGAYVGPIDIFTRQHGQVVRSATYQLPVGRELLGCATNNNITVFAGGKPPHPPAPVGETTEIDIWNHGSGKWTIANLSVERKKVEAIAIGDDILMAGGEIGNHPPGPSPRGRVAMSDTAISVGDYSSSVDILNVKTGKMSTNQLALARQYFAVASAGGKAFFGGGFANYGVSSSDVDVEIPLAGYRSNLVDIYDSHTSTWSVAHLSTNRSNLMGTSVLDRYVLFAGGTRQESEPDLCGTLERSAVVDIYDTVTNVWSTDCLHNGRTSLYAVSVGATAVFFGGTEDPIDMFTFPVAH